MNLQELFEQADTLSTTYLLLDGEVVWDYKLGKKDLYLITSPVKGIPFSEYVSIQELVEYVEREGRSYEEPELFRELDLTPVTRVDKKITNTEYSLLKLL